MPGAINHHRLFMPLFPLAFESFNLSGYDLVLSSHHMAAKGVITTPSTCHICFCHTPMRYAWDFYHDFIRENPSPLRTPLRLLFHYLRAWDTITASRVDYFIANSRNVANRIHKYYRRNSEVIHSPVQTARFHIADKKEGFYLVVSRLVSYKRIDLAVETFNQLGKKLVVVGSGPELKKLKKMARKNIDFTGFVPDAELPDYYARCRAFIFPAEEDFGITPLEAQAAGTPVVAYRAGGALESVLDGKTGIFFDRQTPDSLAQAVLQLEKTDFNPIAIRQHAEKFDVEIFKNKIQNFIEDKMKLWSRNKHETVEQNMY